MTTYYVSSVTGLNTNAGTTWAAAYDTLSTLLTGAGGSAAFAAGDIAFVDDRHAQTQASALTLSMPGTITNPSFVLCGDHNVQPPTATDLKTTGTITTTGASAITIQGYCSFYGLTWNCGTGASAANLQTGGNGRTVHEASLFALLTTSTTSKITANSGSGTSSVWNNCKVQFSNASQQIQTNAFSGLIWRNSPNAIVLGTVPTVTLINHPSASICYVDGVDFSNLSGGQLVTNSVSGKWTYKDCLLPASITTVLTANVGPGTCVNDVIRCDVSGAGNTFRVEHGDTGGRLQTETTIVRTGGANDGLHSYSRKANVSATGGSWAVPWELPPIAAFCNQTGTRTVTVHAVSNIAAGGFPNNDDIWIETSFYGSATTCLASFANNSKANALASNTAYTSDGATWGGSPTGGSFAMSVTINVQQIGFIYVTVKCAKVSTIFYIDPLVTIT